MPQVEAGKLRALAVTSAKRFASVPNLPTMSEAGVPGYEAVSWNGLAAPAATPREILSRIQQDVARVLQLVDIKERFFRDGIAPVGSTPEQFAAHIRSERAKWEKVADAAGLLCPRMSVGVTCRGRWCPAGLWGQPHIAISQCAELAHHQQQRGQWRDYPYARRQLADPARFAGDRFLQPGGKTRRMGARLRRHDDSYGTSTLRPRSGTNDDRQNLR
jgi:hypothetical protein